MLPFFVTAKKTVTPSVKDFVGLAAVRKSKFFNKITADGLRMLSAALDFSLDRKALKDSGVVPGDVEFDSNRRADVQRARAAMEGVTLEGGTVVQTLVHESHAGVFRGMALQIKGAIGLQLKALVAHGQPPELAVLKAAAEDASKADAVLVNSAIMEAIKRDPHVASNVVGPIVKI